ncbi:hypothetical protein Droror1_Dr00011366 [Drosera rotundifolia]
MWFLHEISENRHSILSMVFVLDPFIYLLKNMIFENQIMKEPHEDRRNPSDKHEKSFKQMVRNLVWKSKQTLIAYPHTHGVHCALMNQKFHHSIIIIPKDSQQKKKSKAPEPAPADLMILCISSIDSWPIDRISSNGFVNSTTLLTMMETLRILIRRRRRQRRRQRRVEVES